MSQQDRSIIGRLLFRLDRHVNGHFFEIYRLHPIVIANGPDGGYTKDDIEVHPRTAGLR